MIISLDDYEWLYEPADVADAWRLRGTRNNYTAMSLNEMLHALGMSLDDLDERERPVPRGRLHTLLRLPHLAFVTHSRAIVGFANDARSDVAKTRRLWPRLAGAHR